MSSTPSTTAQSLRNRQLVFPREHGAWGMLFLPLVTGAFIGVSDSGSTVSVFLFAIAAAALFCLRTPVESLAGGSPLRVANTAERWLAIRFALLYVALAALAVTLLMFWQHRYAMTGLGASVAGLLTIQTLIKRAGRAARMPAQMIGALALTATAPGAYCAATGHLDMRAIGLWLANWAFAGNQIHFVQLCLRASKCRELQEKWARGRGFLLGQAVMMLTLASLWFFGALSALVFVAFLPVIIRGLVWFISPPRPLALHRLGLTELAHAVTFGMLLVVGLS